MKKIYPISPLLGKASNALLKKCMLSMLLTLFCALCMAQAHKVSGIVQDNKGVPLPGVSVKIKGTAIGTVTNTEGAFSINVPNDQAVLTFTFIGFIKQEKLVGSAHTITIVMAEQSNTLNDVVVVGYGTQKKADLTGSVATITGKSLQDRPITNLSSGLAGLAPGLYVHQTTGQPGSDGASFNIRGTSTLSSANVLVLVDGIQGRIDDVNPQDVESISILKDAASTAIYGALGANGVVLITTRKGTGKSTLTYNGIFSGTTPTRIPKYLNNSVQYMNLLNEASLNVGGAVIYTPDIIKPYMDAATNPNGLTPLGIPNYVAYANTDWAKTAIKRSDLQNNTLSVSGSADNISYLLSIGYINNTGIVGNSGYSGYRARINVEAKVNDYVTVGTTTFANYDDYGEANSSDFLNYLRQTTPMAYPYYNGFYGIDPVPVDGATGNVDSRLYTYTGDQTITRLNSTWYLKAKLWKGLSFEPRFNYSPVFNEDNYYTNPKNLLFKNFQTSTAVSNTDQADPTSLYAYNNFSKSYMLTMESLLRYNTVIAKNHNIGILLGYNQYQVHAYNTAITAKGLVDGSVNAISTASSFPSNPTGSITSNYAFRSFFGRLNYNFKDKYLFEANLRRDGSSRFGPQGRFGYFPSVSAGWNIYQEPVIKRVLDKADINSFKIRGSYGRVGNVASGDYDWQALYSTVNTSLNGTPVVGVRQSKIANPILHWETTAETDLGLDILAFKGLSFTADWFNKSTSGILYTPPIDITVGTASAPTVNLAAVQAKGIEFQLGWNGNKGQFRYSVNGNFTYNYFNNVTQYKGLITNTYGVNPINGGVSVTNNISAVSTGGSTRVVQGHPIGEYYLQTVYKGTGTYVTSSGAVDPNGGPKDGMIRSDADLNWVKAMQAAGYKFAPVNTVGASNLYKGDLIYADNNNDGIYGNTADAKFQKVSTQPKYLYGLNFNLSYKGFNLSALLAGAAGMSFYTQYDYVNSVFVRNGSSIPTQVANNHYSSTDLNAYYPRLKTNDAIDNVASNFWLVNAAYLKLKNVQLGYTLPQRIMDRFGGKVIKSLNIYVTGENILTLSGFKIGDPELGSIGTTYPIMKQYALGINAKF